MEASTGRHVSISRQARAFRHTSVFAISAPTFGHYLLPPSLKQKNNNKKKYSYIHFQNLQILKLQFLEKFDNFTKDFHTHVSNKSVQFSCENNNFLKKYNQI